MKFYILEPDGGRFGTKWAYGETVEPIRTGSPDYCPVCRRPVGMRKWIPPHYLRLSSAKPEKWGDFLWGAGFHLMVSIQFQSVYDAENLSGITKFYSPANVVRIGNKKTGEILSSAPDYRLIEILWNGANLDDKASQAVRKQIECEFDRGAVDSLSHVVIETNSWTGIDIFEARGLPGITIVSERFKQVVVAHKLRNLRLIPAELYAYDEDRPGGWYVLGGDNTS